MVLEYKPHIKFEAMAPILEEYAMWFGNIALYTAYIDDMGDDKTPVTTIPNSFNTWLKNPETQKNLNNFLLKDMTKAHDDMVRVAGKLSDRIKENKKPTKIDFEELQTLYNAFLIRFRRMEKDTAYEGSGFDPETGLRSSKVMIDDLKEEMERLGRHGSPFCLVSTRIDFFAGKKDQSSAIEIVVRNIKKCVRSFDDAYYMGQGEFFLSLKHADRIGIKSAIARLQSLLEYDEDNKDAITMSYCLVEPTVGDDVSQLISNMHQDLVDHMNEANILLELVEKSALERYAEKL